MAFKMKAGSEGPMKKNFGSALKHKGTHPGPGKEGDEGYHKEHKTTFVDKLKSEVYSSAGGNKGTHAYNDKKQEFRNHRAASETWEKADPKTRGDKPKSPSWMTGY
jgi:hypothetical protein